MCKVRPATLADIPFLMEMARHSQTAAQWSSRHYEQMLAAGAGHVAMVIEDHEGLQGFLAARETAGEWEIENMVVHGAARERGLGSRMMSEFLEMAGARGGRAVFLEVRESNVAARGLYAKWAFVETGRRKLYYQNPLEDALLLRFNFPPRP